jgi:hypothetical protein
MFKKTITFEDFEGNQQSQDFYFHISKSEFMELATNGDDMKKRIERMIATSDITAILNELRAFIKMSVGIRSEDGVRFLKTPEAQSYLLDSPAYDELLMELATNADASAAFINQLVSEKMQKEMRDQLQKQKNVPDPFAEKEDDRPDWVREHRHPTDAEVREMTKEQLAAAFRTKIGRTE